MRYLTLNIVDCRLTGVKGTECADGQSKTWLFITNSIYKIYLYISNAKAKYNIKSSPEFTNKKIIYQLQLSCKL